MESRLNNLQAEIQSVAHTTNHQIRTHKTWLEEELGKARAEIREEVLTEIGKKIDDWLKIIAEKMDKQLESSNGANDAIAKDLREVKKMVKKKKKKSSRNDESSSSDGVEDSRLDSPHTPKSGKCKRKQTPAAISERTPTLTPARLVVHTTNGRQELPRNLVQTTLQSIPPVISGSSFRPVYDD